MVAPLEAKLLALTPAVVRPHPYCPRCGVAFPPEQPWPRKCTSCGAWSFLNPVPVAVGLVPVDDGILVIRRGIAPHVGELALPGGFMDLGETWEQTLARELFEETALRVEPASLRLVTVKSAPDGSLLIFGQTPRLHAAELPPFSPCDETTERQVLTGPQALAFELHTEQVARFFAARGGPGRAGGT
jgi:ADP-ribose pyrophosphatase YjhB (NUDIX family)